MNNDALLKQLIRQMKFLNFFIAVFGTLGIVAIVALGFIVFQLVTFIGETNARLQGVRDEISQSADIKAQACGEGSSLREFLVRTGACD